MIELKWNFPNLNYDRKRESETIRKMRMYGLHASEVILLEEEGEI